ncbi:MAG: thioredoxin domain-containing protein, partial [Methylotetracoccus sp.]|nr:thioredoxin domain-containing protein [Methylotetracoccus sp.]
MLTPPTAKNRLQTETSPYLLQHANNPVDWYPWGEEALTRARSDNKPILLSIGYSACHWCHVMAHESFEDADTAALMNELFVNIKVDREERPDLDKIYQLAHQLLTRRAGGWPLTVFLDPYQHLPFFAGTYFPKTPRFNLPGFSQVLRRVASYYQERHDDFQANQQALQSVLDAMNAEPPAAATMDERVLIRAEDALAENFDPVHGGFGQAPKFPHTSDLALLQTRARIGRRVNERNLRIVEKSLTAMALGGIYDHLGGGFFRYSVDAHWGIPHFEKMLYDNGPLLALYSEAWQVIGNPLFRRVTEETADWVLREMQADDGGFFSSLDADSEGVEGNYYAWDRTEIAAVLPDREARIFQAAFGLEEIPNFEQRWHLYRAKSDADLAQEFGVEPEKIDDVLRTARQTLLLRRDVRVRPGRDEKVLVAWNALMIKGLARAGRILDRSDWVAAAYRAFDFIHAHCWHDGRLRAAWKDGKAPLNAYLDDHVMLIDAALELLQAEWRTEVLLWAAALADLTLKYFEDPVAGGFFFTSS